jgi:uncharacterized protein (TIGR03083 family)
VGEPGYHVYDVAAYIGVLRHEGELLCGAAQRAGMGAAVPACPGWRVADLLRHTSYVHRWAAGIVAQRLARPPDGLPEEEILRLGPDDGELVDWFREGHAALVRTLEQAPPDVACWAFLRASSPLAFWARRQAHETAIHRADAEQAAAAAGHGDEAGPQFAPAFAADGVDELIMGFLYRAVRRGRWPGLGGDLAVHAGDGGCGQDWLVAGQHATASVSRRTGPAGCAVAGRARDLYLLLWNRAGPGPLRVTGDPAILGAFGRQLRIT